MKSSQVALLALATLCPLVSHGESKCFGTVSNGRIEASVKLPLNGENFSSYSAVAAAAGRTHVHSKVASIIQSAYAALAKATPEVTYVYGETGWPSGGRIRPHRTHQNGLSVDFFVPVRDRSGKSVPLPTSVTNRLGYDIEFDANAQFGEFTIDFPALAEHLYQLDRAAKAQGSALSLVILDPPYLEAESAVHEGQGLGASR
jgi:penicillin-insensitive murein DD-endopeptidase